MYLGGTGGTVEGDAGPVFDAAIVLGASLRPDGTPSAALERRVRHGAALCLSGRAGHLVMAGGAVAHARPEALAMRDLALALGLAPARVMVEDRSRNTIENALYTLPLAHAHGWRRLAVVTDLYHLPRALYVFRRLGQPVAGLAVPPPRPPGRDWLLAGLREVPALPWTMVRLERRLR